MAVNDVQKMLDEIPMSKNQTVAVIIIGLLSALDGYDVLAMTFAAPGVGTEFGIGKAALGIALSSGLAGMALGSFFMAPLGDRFGKRAIVLASLVFMGVGMLMSAFVTSVIELSAWRIFTGIGIGALVPVIAPLAAEFSNARRRRLAMAVMSFGYPVGGTIGGFAAAALLQYYSWHSVFLLGAAMSALLLLAALAWLPEPPAFLIAKQPANALERLNTYLRRCGVNPVSTLPDVERSETGKTSYRQIFADGHWRSTLLITAVNLLFILSVYYILSWMPQLVADLGHTASFATLTSALACSAGVAACIAFGLFGTGIPLRWLAATQMIGLAVAIVAFGLASQGTVVLLLMAAAVGIFLYSGILGLYSAIVESFSPRFRSTGVGFVMGCGRVGGAITPALAGWLFEIGMSRDIVSIIMSLGALAAGILMISWRQQ